MVVCKLILMFYFGPNQAYGLELRLGPSRTKNELLSEGICLGYPQYTKHLTESYFNRKNTWAISVRNDEKLSTYSMNTSNYVEASFRITKDGQFSRKKTFNLADQLETSLLCFSVQLEKALA